MLQRLSLDNAGKIVYLAMLNGPATDIGGLSGRTGLPEDCVAAALAALASLGLARPGDPPGRWQAVTPRPEPVPSQLESLADLESVHARARGLARTAISELRVTVAAPSASTRWDASGILGRAGPADGVRLSVLCCQGVRHDPVAMAHVVSLRRAGAQVRITADLPPVLMISDQRAALVALSPADPATGAVCVREPAIVATFCSMFTSTWNTAAPLSTFTPARGGNASALEAGERALLRLLATGLTDEAAARQLGISVRTARRQMAALMSKLGASSRFQAGHKAAELGWLSDAGPGT